MKIGLYIHIPFCSAKCGYCDFASMTADIDTQKKYVAALKNEIRQRCMPSNIENVKHNALNYNNNKQKYNTNNKTDKNKGYTVETVFVGGGTPSVLYGGGLTEIITEIKNCTDFKPVEFTVEANPESITPEFAQECKSLGANRISLGLQTASPHLLKTTRRHTYDDFLQAINMVRQVDINNISADIMLALPNQTIGDIEDTVNKLLKLSLKHISAYGLKVEPNTPLGLSGYVPDDDQTAIFYDRVRALLKDKYTRYEVSNFAVDGYECFHNLKYWTMQPYLGVGLNASSYLNQKRLTNTRDINAYISGNYKDFCEDASNCFLEEYIMLGLRTKNGIDKKILCKKGLDINVHKGFIKFIDTGILIVKGENIVLNDDYYYVANSIVSELI